MLNRILRRIRREPLPAVAVLIFSAVLALLLSLLRQNQLEEMENYENAYASVPVYFTVVDLDGTHPDKTIVGWAADLFYPEGKLKPNFSEFVKDLLLKMQYIVFTSNSRQMTVTGVSSAHLIPELTEAHGGSITWVNGYDESLFESDEYACLVPEGFIDGGEFYLNFDYVDQNTFEHWSCTQQFTIAGYTTSRDTAQIYCSYNALAKIQSQIRAPYDLIGIGATLNDNARLEELRRVADHWFAQPNKNGDPTEWGHYGYDHYPYALEIDDALLQSLNATMEQSMTINRLSALAIFALSAGAGFLVGFLVIRSRKREIALMRTLGTANSVVCLELAIEQILCVSAGIVLGGSHSLWNPVGQLCLFAGIYIAGLTAALLIFVRSNLLAVIKEDE